LSLSNFNTNNIRNISHIFSDCSSLSSLNLTNFNPCFGTNMKKIFSGLKNSNIEKNNKTILDLIKKINI
jgi:hypothetical protein